MPPNQAETMVAALERNGVPHAYLAFEGEQHGFRKAETRSAAWRPSCTSTGGSRLRAGRRLEPVETRSPIAAKRLQRPGQFDAVAN